jgi:hypothetical protein
MNNINKDRTIKYMKTSDFPSNIDIRPAYPNNTVMTYDEIKKNMSSMYGRTSFVNDLIIVGCLRRGNIIDSRILITGVSREMEEIQIFDLRTYSSFKSTFDDFLDFIRMENIDIDNIIDIRERLFDNVNYNNNIKQMSSEFKSMFDDKMKAVVEVVCEEAAKKFTENFIDEMMMIREREEDY